MNKQKQYFFYLLFVIAGGSLFFSSCTVYNDVRYMKDIPKSSTPSPAEVVAKGTDTFEPIKIIPYDIVQVSINTLDPQINAIFNQSSEGIAGNSANSGTLVDKDGIIVIPVIGKVHVAGLTTSQARDTINQIANLYLKDPIVNVRIANFKITVIGEVSKPSQIIISDEKVSVFDAIGLAGELSIYGRRKNVMLIRHHDNEQTYVRLDLSSSKFTSSPYYYLRQGDILYVEPLKIRSVLLNPKTRDIALLSTVISLAALLINFSTKK